MLERLAELFLSFFKTGLFTFGGGHSMIALITQEAQAHGYISYEGLIDMIAVSESTPGPFAVNIATYVGKTYAGVFGSVAATTAVALPSFLIIWLIAKYFDKIKENPVFRKTLSTVLPVAIALVATSGISIATFALTGVNFSLSAIPAIFTSLDPRAIVIFLVVGGYTLYATLNKKQNPILTILLGALCGVVMFGFF